jgi:hypothetical protein
MDDTDSRMYASSSRTGSSSVLGAPTIVGDALGLLGTAVIELGEYANLSAALRGSPFPREDDSQFPKHVKLYDTLVKLIWYASHQFFVFQVDVVTYPTHSTRHAIILRRKALRIVIAQINIGHIHHLVYALGTRQSHEVQRFLYEVLLCMPWWLVK